MVPQSQVNKLVASAKEKGSKTKFNEFRSQLLGELGVDDFDEVKELLANRSDPSEEEKKAKEAKRRDREFEKMKTALESERAAREALQQSVKTRDERTLPKATKLLTLVWLLL
jgi:hypothetical protein